MNAMAHLPEKLQNRRIYKKFSTDSNNIKNEQLSKTLNRSLFYNL